MTKASINFMAVKSAFQAVAHSARTASPSYLLPPEMSFGTIVVLDDLGTVAKTLDAKRSLASRQALRQDGYSPLWEGILNLRRPSPGESAEDYKKDCSEKTNNWTVMYEALTGHKVLRVDIHLDEGRIEDGEVLLNGHAHIISDRTDAAGRVIKLSPKQLRELQTATAAAVELERGEDARVTGRKHISHYQYKALAEAGRLESRVAVAEVKSELAEVRIELAETQANLVDERQANVLFVSTVESLKAQYDADRTALKASGAAKQADYQALKIAHAEALTDLAAAKAKLDKGSENFAAYQAQTKAANAVGNAAIKQARSERDTARAGLAAAKTELAEYKGKPAKPADQAAPVDKFKAMADAYQAHKAAGGDPALFQPAVAPTARPVQAVSPSLQGSLFAPTLSRAPPQPQKSLLERLRAAWDALATWVKTVGGVLEPASASSTHSGEIVKLGEMHAVQHTHSRQFFSHDLSKLDTRPELGQVVQIRYADGVGHVTPEPVQAAKRKPKP